MLSWLFHFYFSIKRILSVWSPLTIRLKQVYLQIFLKIETWMLNDTGSKEAFSKKFVQSTKKSTTLTYFYFYLGNYTHTYDQIYEWNFYFYVQ
jgi:hypothetical protein